MKLISKKIRFTEIYTKYYPAIFSKIYHSINSIDIAEDLTHEVFIQFLSSMDNVQHVQSWLYTVLKRILYDYYKKNEKIPEYIAEYDFYENSEYNDYDRFHDIKIMLSDIIDGLDYDDRLILDMVAVHKLTFKLAGSHLGLSRYCLRYKYRNIVKGVLDNLKNRGLKNIESCIN